MQQQSYSMQEATQQQRPEFALSLLRVIFTTNLMPESPLLCALTEDIVLGLLLRQQGSSRPKPSGSQVGQARQGQREQPASLHSGSRHGLDRQGSYTEVALATPIVTDTVSNKNLSCNQAGPACYTASLTCLMSIVELPGARQKTTSNPLVQTRIFNSS